MDYVISKCEVCQNQQLKTVLKLGSFPLCDDLIPITSNDISLEYPIEILFCKSCFTAHQKYNVPKNKLFPLSYHYRARFTADVVRGMKDLTQKVNDFFIHSGVRGKKIVDIGSNDGTLLDTFKELGAVTIGVEPTDAALDSEGKGHFIYQKFFDRTVVNSILNNFSTPDIITFTNVFAHIEDLPNLINNLNLLMSSETLLIIENHYLGAVLSKMQFDTFYHEHPRTYSVKSFKYIADSLGAEIIKIEFPKRYGGNVRVYIQKDFKNNDSFALDSQILKELDFEHQFTNMEKSINNYLVATKKLINELVNTYGVLPAKAFPGRAAILVKMLGLTESQISAVYEKPGSKKIGHFLPGTRIPIKSDSELTFLDNNLPIINLAWHIAPEISEYLRSLGYLGKVINIVEPESLMNF